MFKGFVTHTHKMVNFQCCLCFSPKLYQNQIDVWICTTPQKLCAFWFRFIAFIPHNVVKSRFLGLSYNLGSLIRSHRLRNIYPTLHPWLRKTARAVMLYCYHLHLLFFYLYVFVCTNLSNKSPITALDILKRRHEIFLRTAVSFFPPNQFAIILTSTYSISMLSAIFYL